MVSMGILCAGECVCEAELEYSQVKELQRASKHWMEAMDDNVYGSNGTAFERVIKNGRLNDGRDERKT